jgi:hypothetical protein
MKDGKKSRKGRLVAKVIAIPYTTVIFSFNIRNNIRSPCAGVVSVHFLLVGDKEGSL